MTTPHFGARLTGATLTMKIVIIGGTGLIGTVVPTHSKNLGWFRPINIW